MKLILDTRETQLITLCKPILSKSIELEVKPLDIGDALILDDEGHELLIIERKAVSDLLSSIKDGRYAEQSHRLSGYKEVHNHNIFYLIEGSISSIDKSLVMASMVSLSYYKGFSVIRTFNVQETAFLLCSMVSKIGKEQGKRVPFYQPITETGEETNKAETDSYSTFIKKKKSDNITPSNFLEIILCQIPSISTITAKAICGSYTDLKVLIRDLEEDKFCLSEIKSNNRKIGKKCSEKVYMYLCNK